MTERGFAVWLYTNPVEAPPHCDDDTATRFIDECLVPNGFRFNTGQRPGLGFIFLPGDDCVEADQVTILNCGLPGLKAIGLSPLLERANWMMAC